MQKVQPTFAYMGVDSKRKTEERLTDVVVVHVHTSCGGPWQGAPLEADNVEAVLRSTHLMVQEGEVVSTPTRC